MQQTINPRNNLAATLDDVHQSVPQVFQGMVLVSFEFKGCKNSESYHDVLNATPAKRVHIYSVPIKQHGAAVERFGFSSGRAFGAKCK